LTGLTQETLTKKLYFGPEPERGKYDCEGNATIIIDSQTESPPVPTATIDTSQPSESAPTSAAPLTQTGVFSVGVGLALVCIIVVCVAVAALFMRKRKSAQLP
jgi:hypothetical protein